jgi:hypothetical protein
MHTARTAACCTHAGPSKPGKAAAEPQPEPPVKKAPNKKSKSKTGATERLDSPPQTPGPTSDPTLEPPAPFDVAEAVAPQRSKAGGEKKSKSVRMSVAGAALVGALAAPDTDAPPPAAAGTHSATASRRASAAGVHHTPHAPCATYGLRLQLHTRSLLRGRCIAYMHLMCCRSTHA